MIRLAALQTAAFLLAASLHAQSSPSIGVELGFTRAGFTGSGAQGVTSRDGAVAGAYFRVPLSRSTALQSGIQIASRGGATTVADSAGSPLRFELDLVYLDLPFVLRARLPGIAGTRLLLVGGGGPALQIGCNVEFTRGGFSLLRTRCDRATTATFRSFDAFVLAGAGLAIPIERSELAIEARFTRGLRSVSDIADIRNQWLDFMLSVPF